MKNFSGAGNGHVTLREKYRRAAIGILRKQDMPFLDIHELREWIELEVGRKPSADELIAAINREDCGLKAELKWGELWVIYDETEDWSGKRK